MSRVRLSLLEGKEYSRDIMLRNTYGISSKEYDKLLEGQYGCCAICKEPAPIGKVLCVDHNHDTGEVRGLLCGNCNTGLGMFKR